VKIGNLFMLLGVAVAAKKTFDISYPLYGQFYRQRFNLRERYGEDTWAVVTGASDGIGRAICKELAHEGFNIILIARNENKIKSLEMELKDISSGIKTQVISTSLESTDPEFFNSICKKFDDKDVAVLVNNVGQRIKGDLVDNDPKEIAHVMTVDAFPTVFFTRFIAPKMLQRERRSAIVNLSSYSGARSQSGQAVYSASKAFDSYFSDSIAHELNDQIDVLTVKPFSVRSKMNRKQGFFSVEAGECAESIFNELGYETATYGHWKHSLKAILYDAVPDSIYHKITRGSYNKYD